jgi:hypothetical protein
MKRPESEKLPLSRVFWFGLALFVIGTGPLLMVILLSALGLLADPNPNPVGLGILAAITFWPSVLMMLVSYARAVMQRDKARKAER